MREAKKGNCKKCGVYFYVHEHHILPRSIFGNQGNTVELCPNCHTHFHEYSKKHTQNPKDEQEARKLWNIWFTSVPLIVSILLVVGLFLWSR